TPLRRLLGLRLVEEVELDVGVALGHGAGCRRGPVNSTATLGRERSWTYCGRTVTADGPGCTHGRRGRARPRPLPAAAPARERRLGLGLARAGRADGARRRAEDRPAGGEGRPPRRARGGGGVEAAARALP